MSIEQTKEKKNLNHKYYIYRHKLYYNESRHVNRVRKRD